MNRSLDAQLFIDRLSHPTFLKRCRDSNRRSEPFRQSFGRLMDSDLLLDCTSGFGRDLLCMASWGPQVCGLERNELIHQCLKAALVSLGASHPMFEKISSRLKLFHADARHFLPKMNPAPTHIYIDPIYPDREKSALGKLELRLLKAHVGKDLDASEVLEIALRTATKRVVVKRPSKAPHLNASSSPTGTCAGKSTRYDFYIIH